MRRDLLTSGELEWMVRDDGLSGLTSTPPIFEKVIVGSTDYDEALAELRGASAPDAKAPTRPWRSPTCMGPSTSFARSAMRR
jgi:transaldolase